MKRPKSYSLLLHLAENENSKGAGRGEGGGDERRGLCLLGKQRGVERT